MLILKRQDASRKKKMSIKEQYNNRLVLLFIELQVSTLAPSNPKKEECETSIQKVMNPELYIKHPLQNR